MDLFPNTTAVVSFILFIITYAIVSILIIRPALRIVARRERDVYGVGDAAKAIEDQAGDKKSDYQEKLKALRSEGTSLRSGTRASALSEEKDLVTAAQVSIKHKSDAMAEELTHEVERVKDQLYIEHAHLARDVARRILGRQV